MSQKQRKIAIFNVNPQQEKILRPFYLSCLVSLCFFVAFGYFLYHHPLFSKSMDGAAFVQADQINGVKLAIVAMGLATFGLMMMLIYWAYTVSNRVLGPCERIIRELDAILAGKQHSPLRVRKDDEMFASLIKRINTLIKKQGLSETADSSESSWN